MNCQWSMREPNPYIRLHITLRYCGTGTSTLGVVRMKQDIVFRNMAFAPQFILLNGEQFQVESIGIDPDRREHVAMLTEIKEVLPSEPQHVFKELYNAGFRTEEASFSYDWKMIPRDIIAGMSHIVKLGPDLKEIKEPQL